MSCTPITRSVSLPGRRHMLVGTAGLLVSGWAAARTVGSGHLQSETRSVADFDAIAVADSIDLVVRQGKQEGLTLDADDNLLPLIETVVENRGQGHTLVIRLRRGESITTRQPMRATVDVVQLQRLSLSGSGDAQVAPLKTPALRLSIAGSGDARLESLTAETLEVRVAGSGDVQASGTAGQVKLSIAGSGDVNLASLQADDVTISIAGSGDAQVTANKSLGVSIAGSGDVRWGGQATALRSSIAGSGAVNKR
jgi:carbon monoxide dehydrogenase subunit G